jgi:hypothetical protein
MAASKSWAELMDELDEGWDTRGAVVPSFLNQTAAVPPHKLSKAEKEAAAVAEKAAAKNKKVADREATADAIYIEAKDAFVKRHSGEPALESFLKSKDATNPPQVRLVIGIKIGKMTPEQKESVTIQELIIAYFEEKYNNYVTKVFSKKAKGGARRRTVRKTGRKLTHRKRKTVHRKRAHRSRKH